MPNCHFNNPKERTGEITLKNPERNKRLFMPLFNNAGMMSAITPDLKGDIKLSQNEFLMPPMSTEDLYSSLYSRNFWIVPKKGEPWSATGVSAENAIKKAKNNHEKSKLNFQPGLLKITRENADLRIEVKIQVFVPANEDKVEILIFTVKNLDNKDFEFSAVPAIPIYARSADNLRDHRQVTTLLNRIYDNKGGVNVRPVMSFDERGHKKNFINYTVLAFEDNGKTTDKKYLRLADFIGQGTLEAPEAVFKKFNPPKDVFCDGKEAIAAFGFTKNIIKKQEEKTFIVVNAITSNEADLDTISEKYNTKGKVLDIMRETTKFWQKQIKQIFTETGDTDFDNWFLWITFQPMARKIYGCSFLPDFDYGRGGRGWRDLWQDCLALILTDPDNTKDLLFNNFAGVRMDGSNATIIGKNSREFIADRNNITRSWMDHGVWPLLTLNLYINQTGDLDILLRHQNYFKDLQGHRSRKKDYHWNSTYGNKLLTLAGDVYEGTILEHLLIQNITQFFNVGDHNICRLEDADWNDGLDMAHKMGESVAFHTMYAYNLDTLADYLDVFAKKGITRIDILAEAKMLFDTMADKIDYYNFEAKQELLGEYMEKVFHKVSGNKISLEINVVAIDLRIKAKFMRKVVQENEFIKVATGEQFFNGYYNNDGHKVEGDNPLGVRMTLTGQVFPIMSNTATDEQVLKCYKAAKKYLKDPVLGGYRLNTNFKEICLNLGRAFSFSYGDKENGAFFSHMIVMFIYALYSRGFVKEGWEVFSSVFKMCMDTETNQILPSIPEYFDSDGKGAYLYLTGSASWMVLTITRQIFGISSYLGDFVIEPKLVKEQFQESSCMAIYTSFAGKRVKITYHNHKKLDYNKYKIKKVIINGQKNEKIKIKGNSATISKNVFKQISLKDKIIDITVDLA